MFDSEPSFFEALESSDLPLAEQNRQQVTGLIAASLQFAGPDELPDELGFNSCI
jgi:hypothetical protein